MIITVTLNPCIDKTLQIDNFKVDSVCRANILKIVAGGKGINVSRAVKELGGKTKAIGIIGGGAGQLIIDRLCAEGIDSDFIDIQGELRTCYGILDKINQTETVINESGPYVSEGETVRFTQLFEDTIDNNDMVALSGSAPTGVKKDIYYDLIKIAHKKKAKIFLDTSDAYLSESIDAIPYAIKINRSELENLFRTSLAKRELIIEKIKILLNTGIYMAIITHGENELIAITKDEGWIVEPLQVKSINSWGSGDCVVAGILTSLEISSNLKDALKLAMAAGAANTLSYGAGIIEKHDVMKLNKKVVIKRL